MNYRFDIRNWDKDLHFFTYNKLNILMDVNSGAVHLIDDLTKKILENLICLDGDAERVLEHLEAFYPPGEILEVLEEIKHLTDEGFLFTEDQPRDPFSDRETIIKSLCLHVAHDCNLRCRYCFGGTGDFGGMRKLMPLDVGQKAIDFLLANSEERPTVEVDFFGGEPLMNWEVVKDLVFYGEEAAKRVGKIIEFTLTTNGLLLNPEIDAFLREHKILLVLSIDGRPKTNDLMRPLAGGQGSYQRIVPRFQRLTNLIDDKDYYVRGTFTHHNLDFAEDVKHLHDLGFNSLSVEPVVASEEEDYAIKQGDLLEIFQEYDRLVELYLARQAEGRPFDFFHFNVDLEKGPCLPKRLLGCGAGYEYLAVTPEGDLYPCHQFVGRDSYRLGDVWQGLVEKAKSKEFMEAHIYHKEACRNCWARFLCSGGCHANADANHGNILEPYELGCQLQKKRLECAIYLYCVNKTRQG